MNSNFSELLDKNTRLIFKYPDGSCSYAYKCKVTGKGEDKQDSWLQVKGRNPHNQASPQVPTNEDLSSFQVIQIEDEVSFLVDNLEYLVEPDQAIQNYFEVRSHLYFVLFLNFVFEGLMTYYIVKNEIEILNNLRRIYRFWHVRDFQNFFEVVTATNSAMNMLMYSYGFYTIYSHKVTNYQIWLVFLMFTIFTGILLTYINVLNLLLFILKCFTYVYARYVLSELYTVLIIPSDLHSLVLNGVNTDSQNGDENAGVNSSDDYDDVDSNNHQERLQNAQIRREQRRRNMMMDLLSDDEFDQQLLNNQYLSDQDNSILRQQRNSTGGYNRSGRRLQNNMTALLV